MTVVAEFEKPTKCEECPCFYQTNGVRPDECHLTHKEIENYFIVDKDCPLKAKKMTKEDEPVTEGFDFKAFLDAGRRASESNY